MYVNKLKIYKGICISTHDINTYIYGKNAKGISSYIYTYV